MKILEKIKRLLGIFNIRDECQKMVAKEYGVECVDDFIRLYDNINNGIPVAFEEAIAVTEIVGRTKRELREKTIWHIMKRRFCK